MNTTGVQSARERYTHGNGRTYIEGEETIHEHLRQFFFMARLISVTPRSLFEDRIIQADQLAAALGEDRPRRSSSAPIRIRRASGRIIIRDQSALPATRAATWIRERGIRHLLLDLPSVDRGTMVASSRLIMPSGTTRKPRKDATITRVDLCPGPASRWLVPFNLQISSIMNDAAPSKLCFFTIQIK